jgi:antitoxin YefM
MRQITVNEFRSHLKDSVDAVAESHTPLRVTRRTGEDFIVVSADDWESEQETLYVLQNRSLMEQISRSLRSMAEGAGYTPTPEELDALDHV